MRGVLGWSPARGEAGAEAPPLDSASLTSSISILAAQGRAGGGGARVCKVCPLAYLPHTF